MLRQLDPSAASIIRHDQKLLTRKTAEGGEDVTRGEAAIEMIYKMGMQGNPRALSEYFRIRDRAYSSKQKLDQQMFDAAVRYQEHYLPIFLRCEELGQPLPDEFPDPRDIEILPDGTVEITGPVTFAQKIQTDLVVEQQGRILESIEAITQDKDLSPEVVEKAQKRARTMLARCNRLLPPRLRRHMSQQR